MEDIVNNKMKNENILILIKNAPKLRRKTLQNFARKIQECYVWSTNLGTEFLFDRVSMELTDFTFSKHFLCLWDYRSWNQQTEGYRSTYWTYLYPQNSRVIVPSDLDFEHKKIQTLIQLRCGCQSIEFCLFPACNLLQFHIVSHLYYHFFAYL